MLSCVRVYTSDCLQQVDSQILMVVGEATACETGDPLDHPGFP